MGSASDPGPDADPIEVARLIILRQLSRGPRTRAQLGDACRRRGVPQDAAQQMLDRFEELGLVDDPAFARAWVESRHVGRGLSRRALRHELRERGIAEDIVEDALSGIDPNAEQATAAALVRARLPGVQRHDTATQLRRLTGLLTRRGYPPGMAAAVVRRVVAHPQGEAFDP
jgi:regulatory protein